MARYGPSPLCVRHRYDEDTRDQLHETRRALEMRKRIYIETTVPSFYYTRRQDVHPSEIELDSSMVGEFAEKYALVSSAAVIAELRRGKSDMIKDRIELLESAELLPITKEVEEIAQLYIAKMIMPKDPQGDALHLAIASFHRADVLLTWNCVHLANANKYERIRLVNFEIGLPAPILTTPLNYLSGGDE